MKIPLRTVTASLLAGVTLCLAGCFSLECAKPDSSDEEHLVVRNYGWRLFYFLPIVCGNTRTGSSFPWSFFNNEVTMDNIQQRFMEHAAKHGKTPCDLVYSNYDTVMWSIPLVEVPIPVPYLLCYNEIQLSGNLK